MEVVRRLKRSSIEDRQWKKKKRKKELNVSKCWTVQCRSSKGLVEDGSEEDGVGTRLVSQSAKQVGVPWTPVGGG